MDESLYRALKWTAIALTVAWVGWSAYDGMLSEKNPGDMAYLEGNNLFEDGAYERALARYEEAIAVSPDHVHALRGKARSLLQMGRLDDALAAFNAAIAADPAFGAAYANRGILNDRAGRYREAIADYDKALSLDPEIAEGPHWLTRFLRNQPEKPAGIAGRAAYLRAELAKPEAERVLRVPEIDEQQRSYKQ